MTGGDQEYIQRLGEILRRLDHDALRRFLAEQAGRFGDERQVAEILARDAAEMEALLHRMIVARPDLAALHAASQRWLTAHGLPLGTERGDAPGQRPKRGAPRSRRNGPHPSTGERPRGPR